MKDQHSDSHRGESSHHSGHAQRGVTRPMNEMEHHHSERARSRRGEAPDHGHEHSGAGHAMPEHQREHMLQQHHRQTLWIYWSLVLLGCWMTVSPLTFSHAQGVVQPAGGREVWLSLEARIAAMTWSDIASGVLLMLFGWRGLTPNRPLSLWMCCSVGVWLTFAPLVFWSPTATGYLNNTFVGALVIALTVLVPGMPNMIRYMRMGGDQPPGWSYNPSSWPQRSILIGLGFAGWVVSRYLGAYQLGYVDHAWDPFFGDGSRRVLESDMSRMWPVSDGGFGAAAYTFEFLMGWMGATSRWRTMPWMVALFGILVIPLGLVHIVLVISQPLVVGQWCFLCLAAAAIMLPMIPLEVDEVIAMGQHLARSKRRGASLWRVFWRGGDPAGATSDERSPELIDLPQHPGHVVRASLWGMSVPWTLAVSAALGVWTMFAPAALGAQAAAANGFHLAGALIVVNAVIAMGEPLRLVRWLNVPLGLALASAPWIFESASGAARIDAAIVGLAVAALSIPRGPRKETYAAWDRWVR